MAPKEQDKGRGLNRRSELEVKMDILRVVGEGADKPTQVMYKANLSWLSLQEHLKTLIGNGLLTEEKYGSRRKYEITPRGLELLQNYQKLLSSVRETVLPGVSF